MKCEKNEYQLFSQGKNGQRRKDEGTKREKERVQRDGCIGKDWPPERKGAARKGGSKR